MRPIRNLYRCLAVLRALGDRVSGLTVSGLRRWAIYRPLAIAMALLLMMPVFSRFEGGGPGARSFQASAQTSVVCPPNPPNLIIQNTCPSGVLIDTNGDLKQFESDSVNAYLGLHELPPSDTGTIYAYGRQDLRDAIRASMIVQLLAIIKKPASQRTQHEQTLYMWLQRLVQQNEIALYTTAIAEAQRFFNDPCTFTLDPDIASTYNLRYNGQPFCAGSLSAIFPPPIPAASYFTAYGFKHSYAAAAQTFPYFGSLMADTSISEGEQAGISLAAGAVVSAAAGAAIASNLSAALVAFGDATDITIEGTSALAAGSSFLLSGSTVSAVGLGTLVAGPIAIILVTIAVGVQAVIEILQNNQNLADIQNLANFLSQAQNNLPDLAAMVADTSGLGLYKIQTTMNAQTVPDQPSSAVLPAHQSTDLNFAIGAGSAPTIADEITYQDWDGNTVTAATWGGWFVGTCTPANQSSKCVTPDSINANLRYVDGAGVKWTASRIGNNFAITKASPSPADSICPANTITGLTPSSADFSMCSSYVSDHITLKNSDGNLETVRLTLLSRPAFTSSTTLVFSPGTASTQTITAAGSPTPNVCLVGGTPSSDFSLNGGNNCGTGSFQVTFNGDINAPTQVYQLSFGASNGVGKAVFQTVSLKVSPQLAIISPSTLNGTGGVPVNFKVVATGVPAPKLSVVGWNLNSFGLNFTDNGNGTATISGVVAHPPTAFLCLSGTCGIQATNSQGTVFQSLSLNFALSPEATLIPPDNANFVAGTTNAQLLGSTGAITPVSWALSAAGDTPLPSWLSLQDNGNGTALLKGTPPIGASGAFPFYIVTDALGAFGGGYNNSFTINVDNRPIFLSSNTATFTVGSTDSFPISTTQGAVSMTGDLPSELTFSSGTSSTISGTPAVGTGGQYIANLLDDAGAGETSTQTLTINVNESPKITSANSAAFFTGVHGSFAVTTTGFPSVSAQPVPQNSLPPASPSDGKGMYFTVSGLPADLTFSNLNPAGFATGTLTIQGTPSAADAGTHQVVITAQNGVGAIWGTDLTLNIVPVNPAPLGSISATASGLAYSRVSQTFNGTVTLKNTGGSSVKGPFEVVFTGLTPGVVLSDETNLLNGVPYLTVPGATSLASGQTAVVNVQFKNLSNVTIQFTPVVYGGPN